MRVGARVVEKKVTDHESDRDREHTWFCLSKAVAIIAVVCGTVAFGWILSAGDEEKMLRRAEIATPLGMAFAAALTFTTVVWRGLVGEFQAREQKRANDQNDREYTAALLLDGAKLLDENKKPSHVAAGIAALEFVVSRPEAKFGNAAMNLLADFLSAHAKNPTGSDHSDAARRAMAKGAKASHRANRLLMVEIDETEFHQFYTGFTEVVYRSGRIDDRAFSDHDSGQLTIMESVKVENQKINDDLICYFNCQISQCEIEKLDTSSMHQNDFISCDFSGARLINAEFETAISEHEMANFFRDTLVNCYYRSDNIPTWEGFLDGTDVSIGDKYTLALFDCIDKTSRTHSTAPLISPTP